MIRALQKQEGVKIVWLILRFCGGTDVKADPYLETTGMVMYRIEISDKEIKLQLM